MYGFAFECQAGSEGLGILKLLVSDFVFDSILKENGSGLHEAEGYVSGCTFISHGFDPLVMAWS